MEENPDPQQKDALPKEYPMFGERPDTGKAYDFKEEVSYLPFQFNLGGAPCNKEQQDQLINLVYNNQRLFSVHTEDLGFCDKLTHTILTATDRQVYLPHGNILQQLQGEVQNAWTLG